MTPNDLIFEEVYKGSLNEGCSERAAKDCAVAALNDYKKGRGGRAGLLVGKYIQLAKRQKHK